MSWQLMLQVRTEQVDLDSSCNAAALGQVLDSSSWCAGEEKLFSLLPSWGSCPHGGNIWLVWVEQCGDSWIYAVSSILAS